MTTTLYELIALLKRRVEDNPELGNLPVYAVSDYGDHSHTQQLLELNEVDEIQVTETAYSDSGLAVAGEDDEIYTGEECSQAVCINDGRLS